MIADGITSPFYCGTKSEAEDFEMCKLQSDACECSLVDPSMNCACKDGKLDQLFDKGKDKILPIKAEEFWIQNEGDQIFATLPKASLQLKLELENHKLSAVYDPAICVVTPIEISGCYSCVVGAKMRAKCVPSIGNAVTHVQCSDSRTQIQQMFVYTKNHA